MQCPLAAQHGSPCPACSLPRAAASSSAPAAHHGSQEAPAPVFFLMILNEPGSGKDGLEQHVLPLSVCNGRPLCPGQLMGTRPCQGVRPPHSAAATALEPAGALRSRAAPASPAPGASFRQLPGEEGWWRQRQRSRERTSCALGCSSSCCSLTGLPQAPDSL